MKAIEAIRTALATSDRWVKRMEEMKDAPAGAGRFENCEPLHVGSRAYHRRRRSIA